jgi:hypothetical protein
MTLFYNESLKIGILLIFSIVLACFIIFLYYFFSTFNSDIEKISAYVYGFEYVSHNCYTFFFFIRLFLFFFLFKNKKKLMFIFIKKTNYV